MAKGPGRVIDGDGHLLEDTQAIGKRMPKGFIPAQPTILHTLFPHNDHLHAAQPLKMLEGAFERVGPEGWLNFLDDVGIEQAALYPTWSLSFGFTVNRDWAIGAARAYNDWLYETYLQKYPGRFIGVGHLPLQEPEAAAAELRRIVKKMGFKGAVLCSTGMPTPLGAAAYWPVYEEANRLGCAITYHGGHHTRMGLDHMEIYAAVNALGHPIGQMTQFTSLLVNGVFDRYPKVRFGFLEGGLTWLMMVIERMERAWATHIPLDPRRHSAQLAKGDTIGDHIKKLARQKRIFVGCEGDEPFVPDLIKALGANPAFFSSDFPHETNRERCRHELMEIAEHAVIGKKERREILSGNSAALYGID